MDITLYTKKYKGPKVTFNSRKASGTMVEGIAVHQVPELNTVVLRDVNNFPHAVHIDSIKHIT